MPITLAQAQVNAGNDVDYRVIDDFRRNSRFMDLMTFDDAAVPTAAGSAGASLGYTYVRKTAGAAAAPRAINTEYVPGQATRAQYSVTLKPLGAKFEIDRVIAELGPAGSTETVFQLGQARVAVAERFVREFLYGDTAVDANTFDGVSKALTGATTELTTATNWVTVATQVAALQELDKLDKLLSLVVKSNFGSMTDGQPGAIPAGVKVIAGNTSAILQLRRLAKWANMYTITKDNFDQDIERYREWELLDLGDRADGSGPIIPTTANVSEIFALSLGIDAVHAVSPAGRPLVRTYLPDLTTPDAVKATEVEMVTAAVVKSTKSAAVYRNITVSA